MCINGDQDTIVSYSGTWSAQALPVDLYVGSDYSASFQVDGIVDSVFDHEDKLNDVLISDMSGERRKYLPVNSFLIQEQDASMVRKNVGATM